MLDTLKFVKGAVSVKEYVPALTHFRIADGRITGFNGKISISAPIAMDVDCCPRADAFVKAVAQCEETAQLHLTAGGKLSIRSGPFRALIDTFADTEYPEVAPEGLAVAIDGELLAALETLYEFTSEDASRPWAAGVLLGGSSARATNNVVLVEQWLGYHFPYVVNLPRYAIKEMMRIGEEPVSMQLTGQSATFHYEGERWLRTQLLDLEWPASVDALLDTLPHKSPSAVPDGFFEALDKIEPFLRPGNPVYLLDNMVATALEEGAAMVVQGVPAGSCFNLKMLSLLRTVATHIGFEHYPAPVPFFGPKLRGAIAGLKL